MISVTSELVLWVGANARWHFLVVPEGQSDQIRAHGLSGPRGFGSVKVQAHIGEIAWRTSVFPQKDGGYLLPVKKEVRCRAGMVAGDQVTVTLDLL